MVSFASELRAGLGAGLGAGAWLRNGLTSAVQLRCEEQVPVGAGAVGRGLQAPRSRNCPSWENCVFHAAGGFHPSATLSPSSLPPPSPASLHGGPPGCGAGLPLCSHCAVPAAVQARVCPTPFSFSHPCLLPPTQGDTGAPSSHPGLPICALGLPSFHLCQLSTCQEARNVPCWAGSPVLRIRPWRRNPGGPTPAVSQV